MKWSLNAVVILIVILLFAGCTPPDIVLQYIPKDNNKRIEFSFKYQPDDSIAQLVGLYPQTIKKKSDEPMFFQTEFKGQRKYAEKLLSVNLKLYAKNESTGLFDNEIIIKNTYSYYSYPAFNYIDGTGEKNYKGDLNKLMYPSEFNTEDRINSIFVDNELLLTEYPKQIKAILVVKWIDGEQEFVTLLTLDEREAGPKVRTNPFG